MLAHLPRASAVVLLAAVLMVAIAYATGLWGAPAARAQSVSVITVAVDESITVSDLPVATPAAAINVLEPISVADAVGIAPAILISITESIVTSDGIVVVPPTVITIEEPITVGDAPNLTPAVSIFITESVGVGDGLAGPEPAPTTVGDFVWQDTNGDGVQDPGEPGLAGVVVTLDGAATATTLTDANGAYEFAGLAPGSYRLHFAPPLGFAFSPQDQGSDDATDSDVDVATGYTAFFSLAAGQPDPTWDAGLVSDLDSDGLPDNFESKNGLNPADPSDAETDLDDDDLSNLREFELRTDVRNPDSDGDGVRDGLEVSVGTDPTDPASVDLAAVLVGLDAKPDAVTLLVGGSAQVRVVGVMVDGTTLDLTGDPRVNFDAVSLDPQDLVGFNAPNVVLGQAQGAADVAVAFAAALALSDSIEVTVANLATKELDAKPSVFGQRAMIGLVVGVSGSGVFLIPEAGDEAEVEFEAGDARRPAVLGGRENGVDVPPGTDIKDAEGNRLALGELLGTRVAIVLKEREQRDADEALTIRVLREKTTRTHLRGIPFKEESEAEQVAFVGFGAPRSGQSSGTAVNLIRGLGALRTATDEGDTYITNLLGSQVVLVLKEEDDQDGRVTAVVSLGDVSARVKRFKEAAGESGDPRATTFFGELDQVLGTAIDGIADAAAAQAPAAVKDQLAKVIQAAKTRRAQEAGIDITRPTVTSFTPENGATGVPTNSNITIVFSEDLDPLSVSATTIRVTRQGTPIGGSFSLAGGTVTFAPISGLPNLANVLVTVVQGGVSDPAGNSVSTDSTISFTTIRALGTVQGNVYEAEGTTLVEGAIVTVTSSPTGEVATYTTSADGHYAIQIPTGGFTVKVVKAIPGVTTLDGATSGTLTSGGDTVIANVLLEATGRLLVTVFEAGTVLDAGGNVVVGGPAPGVQVSVTRQGGGFSDQKTNDANGQALFEFVPLGTYAIVGSDTAPTASVSAAASVTSGGQEVAVPLVLPNTAGVLRFGKALYDAVSKEGGLAAVTLVVQRVGGSEGTVSVDVVADTPDGRIILHTFTFADGDTEGKTAEVTLKVVDLIKEDDSVTITLANPTSGAKVGGDGTATLALPKNLSPIEDQPEGPQFAWQLAGVFEKTGVGDQINAGQITPLRCPDGYIVVGSAMNWDQEGFPLLAQPVQITGIAIACQKVKENIPGGDILEDLADYPLMYESWGDIANDAAPVQILYDEVLTDIWGGVVPNPFDTDKLRSFSFGARKLASSASARPFTQVNWRDVFPSNMPSGVGPLPDAQEAVTSSCIHPLGYLLPLPSDTQALVFKGLVIWASSNANDNLKAGGLSLICQRLQRVQVENLLPEADAGGPYAITEGQSVSLDGSGSSDADGTIVEYRWAVSPGSGVGQPSDTVFLQGAAPTFSPPRYHASWRVDLVITDDDGATASATTSIVVEKAPTVLTWAECMRYGLGGTPIHAIGKDQLAATVSNCGVPGSKTQVPDEIKAQIDAGLGGALTPWLECVEKALAGRSAQGLTVADVVVQVATSCGSPAEFTGHTTSGSFDARQRQRDCIIKATGKDPLAATLTDDETAKAEAAGCIGGDTPAPSSSTDGKSAEASPSVTSSVVYVPIWVSVSVAVRDGADPATVEQAVKSSVRAFLWPLAPGGPNGTGWPLGLDVRARDIEVAVARVAGVASVHSVVLGPHPNGAAVDPLSLQANELPELLSLTVQSTTEDGTPTGPSLAPVSGSP